ncbi:MAG: hypothetical protein ACLULK_08615 [Anaerovoracaceae bacterium]
MKFSKVKKSPILLREENKNYAFDPEKEIRGYVKLEKNDTKGLVVAVMNNVKFFPKGEYVYKLLLVGQKNEKLYYHLMGSMSMTAYGDGEGSFRINPKDLDGCGMPIWKFSAAIIAAMSTQNGREPLHPVLKGEFSLPKEEDTPKDIQPKDYSPFYNKFVLENCINLAKKQQNFESIVPFGKDSTKATWKKITDDSLFPIISPGSKEPVKKYRHFLYGWNNSYYFLGVPGRFFQNEQPDKGNSGFVFWQPILGMEEEQQDPTIPLDERRKNIYGYWIASINRYNGHIEEIPLIQE